MLLQVEGIDTGQGIVIAIISGIVTLMASYMVNVWSKQQDGKNQLDLKRLEVTDNSEDLRNSLTDALNRIQILEQTLLEERQIRARLESQLRDVKTAFSVVYISFEKIVGDNEEGRNILAKLREFIET